MARPETIKKIKHILTVSAEPGGEDNILNSLIVEVEETSADIAQATMGVSDFGPAANTPEEQQTKEETITAMDGQLDQLLENARNLTTAISNISKNLSTKSPEELNNDIENLSNQLEIVENQINGIKNQFPDYIPEKLNTAIENYNSFIFNLGQELGGEEQPQEQENNLNEEVEGNAEDINAVPPEVDQVNNINAVEPVKAQIEVPQRPYNNADDTAYDQYVAEHSGDNVQMDDQVLMSLARCMAAITLKDSKTPYSAALIEDRANTLVNSKQFEVYKDYTAFLTAKSRLANGEVALAMSDFAKLTAVQNEWEIDNTETMSAEERTVIDGYINELQTEDEPFSFADTLARYYVDQKISGSDNSRFKAAAKIGQYFYQDATKRALDDGYYIVPSLRLGNAFIETLGKHLPAEFRKVQHMPLDISNDGSGYELYILQAIDHVHLPGMLPNKKTKAKIKKEMKDRIKARGVNYKEFFVLSGKPLKANQQYKAKNENVYEHVPSDSAFRMMLAAKHIFDLTFDAKVPAKRDFDAELREFKNGGSPELLALRNKRTAEMLIAGDIDGVRTAVNELKNSLRFQSEKEFNEAKANLDRVRVAMERQGGRVTATPEWNALKEAVEDYTKADFANNAEAGAKLYQAVERFTKGRKNFQKDQNTQECVHLALDALAEGIPNVATNKTVKPLIDRFNKVRGRNNALDFDEYGLENEARRGKFDYDYNQTVSKISRRYKDIDQFDLENYNRVAKNPYLGVTPRKALLESLYGDQSGDPQWRMTRDREREYEKYMEFVTNDKFLSSKMSYGADRDENNQLNMDNAMPEITKYAKFTAAMYHNDLAYKGFKKICTEDVKPDNGKSMSEKLVDNYVKALENNDQNKIRDLTKELENIGKTVIAEQNKSEVKDNVKGNVINNPNDQIIAGNGNGLGIQG